MPGIGILEGTAQSSTQQAQLRSKQVCVSAGLYNPLQGCVTSQTACWQALWRTARMPSVCSPHTQQAAGQLGEALQQRALHNNRAIAAPWDIFFHSSGSQLSQSCACSLQCCCSL